MDIQQLKCLVAVRRYENFTTAADAVFMSQSNLSKKIAALENEIGLVLFERSRHTVKTTPAGKLLAAEIEKLLGNLESAITEARSFSEGKEGYLKIGISDELNFNGLLPMFLYDFTKTYPKIDLNITIRNISDLPLCLGSQELDVIFLPYTGKSFYDFQAESVPINRNHPRLYFSRDNKKAKYLNTTIDDFLDESVIVIQPSRDRSLQILEENGYMFKSVITVDSMQSLKIYLEANLGVAILGVSQSFLNTSNVSSIPLPMDTRLIGTDAVYLKNHDNPAVDSFIKELKKYLKID
ncbi:MAG: LysR family transcriptional regulator [Spirochaetales bacterium]|nr:LysR family transcriptional regulator [Spirochaetales bacterium]